MQSETIFVGSSKRIVIIVFVMVSQHLKETHLKKNKTEKLFNDRTDRENKYTQRDIVNNFSFFFYLIVHNALIEQEKSSTYPKYTL